MLLIENKLKSLGFEQINNSFFKKNVTVTLEKENELEFLVILDQENVFAKIDIDEKYKLKIYFHLRISDMFRTS